MSSLSVIIPAYNASGTIQRCLDSIFRLPLAEEDLEVIVIDDCSTDDTASSVEGYGAEHSNLFLIRQTSNHRQGAARNKGIDIAHGDYIAFVDSDDTISTEGIMNALHAVKESHADVCYYDFEYQTSDGNWHVLVVPENIRGSIISSEQYLEDYYTTLFNGSPRTLYKAAFLKGTGVRFVEDVQWEDCDWTVKVYSRSEMIQFVDGIGYRYHFNGNSTCKQRSVKALADRVYAGRRLLDFGREIMNKLPRLSGTISSEGKDGYVVEALRLRNLTKYSFREVRGLHDLIGENGRKALLAYEWPSWVRFFLRNKAGSLAFLHLACPSARMGRSLMRRIRKTGMEK